MDLVAISKPLECVILVESKRLFSKEKANSALGDVKRFSDYQFNLESEFNRNRTYLHDQKAEVHICLFSHWGNSMSKESDAFAAQWASDRLIASFTGSHSLKGFGYEMKATHGFVLGGQILQESDMQSTTGKPRKSGKDCIHWFLWAYRIQAIESVPNLVTQEYAQ